MSTEQKTAQTILQRPLEVEVGGVTYSVAPPTLATLILASEYIAKLPEMETGKGANVLSEVLEKAKDCRPLAEIAAIVILGAKGLTVKSKKIKKRFFGLQTEEYEHFEDKKEELTQTILYNLTPSQLAKIMFKLLDFMEIGDFFGLTTFLSKRNLTKPTREVVQETTALGQ